MILVVCSNMVYGERVMMLQGFEVYRYVTKVCIKFIYSS